MVSLRNVKQKYLNEYRETVGSAVILISCYIVYLVLLAMGLQFQEWARLVCSAIVRLSSHPLLSPAWLFFTVSFCRLC